MRPLVVVLLSFVVASAASAQLRQRIDVIAVDIPISVHDRAGHVPSDLTKDDFQVFEDGRAQRVIGFSYPEGRTTVPPAVEGATSTTARRARTVIYVQQRFSTTIGLRRSLQGLLQHVGELTAFGNVEIDTDFPRPHAILQPTGDPAAVRAALSDAADTIVGQDELRRPNLLADTVGASNAIATPSIDSAFLAMHSRWLIRRSQDEMLVWMSSFGPPVPGTPRLLVLITDGYSINESASASERVDLWKHQADVVETVAAAGWTVYSLAAGAFWQTVQRVTERDFHYARANPMPFEIDRFDPMLMFEAASGGKVRTDATLIGDDLDAFARRPTLTYQVRRRRDGARHRLEIRSRRAGLRIHAQSVVTSGTPREVTAARATELARNGGQTGELPVRCTIEPSRSRENLEIVVELAPLSPLRKSLKSTSLRFAVGVAPDARVPFSTIQQVDGLDLSSQNGWMMEIPLRDRNGAPTAVVAEETWSGAWGGARCVAGSDL